MKRSQINDAILHAFAILEQNALRLPEFAYWRLDDWRKNRGRIDNIKKVMLGWDVTDFGWDRFEKIGGVLFTIRNGHPLDKNAGTPFAEKLIILRHETEQSLPMHFHRTKTEDIINRSSGILAMQLYCSTADGKLDEEKDVVVKLDGIIHTLRPGTVLEVEKGCSVTLTPGLHHRFWAKKGAGDLIVGEVSSINDDNTDNVFLDPQHRFTSVEEDAPIIYPLCNEYDIL